MASLTNDKGLLSIRFALNGGKRHKLRLGRMDKRTAESIVPHVRRLLQAQQLNQPPAEETVLWLSKVTDAFYERLVNAGLCEPRHLTGGGHTRLAIFLDAYIEKRKADMKPWSVKMLQQCRKKLVTYFGDARAIGSITAADAEDFQRAMKVGNSLAYAAKLIVIAKSFFRRAVKARLLIDSPFADLKPGSQKNKARMHFVPAATIEKVIAAEPDPQRAFVYAIARYGGLRIPSELEHLKWSDIDFKHGRIVIRSVKTEHHVGKETRIVPLFPELMPTLMVLYHDPDRHLIYVVPRFRNSKKNLRTHFLQTLKRLEIEPWPKLFQNLRSSRETELCESYPSWAVCDWIGHTPEVAQDHYLNPRQEYFDAAVAGEKVLGMAGPTGPKMGPAPD